MVNGIKLRLAMMEATKSNADVDECKRKTGAKAFHSQEYGSARDSAPRSNPKDGRAWTRRDLHYHNPDMKITFAWISVT
jgi:hypothetical protein